MASSDIDSVAHRALTDASQELRTLSQYLHANPELGRSEVLAHAALTALLKDLGFAVTPHFPCETGFVASYVENDSPQPHVALLCEFDALPDIGHACGHNLIAVVAVAAGAAVRAVMREKGLSGRVSVFGTPAEENEAGKVDFIEAGLFKDVDAAMMAHPVGGTINVANPKSTTRSVYEVEYLGKASHASASPCETVNALDAAVQAYQNAMNLRQSLPPSSRIAMVIKEGYKAANIVPERSTLEFMTRAPNARELERIYDKLKVCAEAAAATTGCEVSISKIGQTYEDVKGNEALVGAYLKHASALQVDMESTHSYSWSTDAGNVSHVVPTIHPLFHIESQSNCHQREFANDVAGETAFQRAIQTARIMASTTVEVLSDDKLRLEMKREFDATRDQLINSG